MPGDWLSYNHDMASTRYSLLTQINANNAATLKSAWTFSLKGEGPPPRFGGGGSEATPIVVNGVMYLPASARVVALDAANGKEVWSYTTTAGRPSTRGVACSPGDKQNPPRIIFKAGRNLIALNATTGKIDPGFGKEGVVDDGGRKRPGSARWSAWRYGGLRRTNRCEEGKDGKQYVAIVAGLTLNVFALP